MTKFTMLDMSTAHLTDQTLSMMEDGTEFDEVVYYPKWNDEYHSNYGYFIHVSEELTSYDEESLAELKEDGLPEDLLSVILFAGENKCDWINIDVDGEIISELPLPA